MRALSPFPSAPAMLTFSFEGRALSARAGETIGAAMIAHGELEHSHAKDGAPRGLYCGMGVCHDCLVVVEGRGGVRACMTKVADGMVVRRQPPTADLDRLSDLAPQPQTPLSCEAVEVLIVGAGPGGLAAADVAAAAGATVTIVDERPAPGGQFFKQPAVSPAAGADRQARDGAALIRRVQERGVDMRSETLVWGAFRDGGALRIGVYGGGRVGYILPKMLIVAAGAFELPGVFPGWTLPGVMTTGACQTLLRSYGRAPGQRVLVAGNGPLNLQIAQELARAGATVVAVAEAAPPSWTSFGAGFQLFASHPGLAIAGLTIVADLRRRRIPIHWRHRIARVEGGERAEKAVLVEASGQERTLAVDIVCVGEGFAPANELVRLLGCAHIARTDGASRLEVERDDSGATSLADVFVVGEAGGFGGAQIAMAQGRLAAKQALRRLGRSVAERPIETRALRRHRRFQKALWTMFAAEEPGLSRARQDTIVCRCEAISLGALRCVVALENVQDVATLKRLSRAGMGRCQGRYCGPRLAELIATPQSERDLLAPQAPLRPVPLAALAVEQPEWGGHQRVLLPPSPKAYDQQRLPIGEAAVVVIGAGIAGVSSALFLARYGWDVVIVDSGRANARASGGNAGSLHAQLLSFDHGAKARSGGSPAASTLPLQRDSIALWGGLERELGADFEIKITGGLMVAETDRDLAFLEEKTRVERSQGVECQVIDASALRDLEPALDPGFVGAAYCPLEGKINPLVATQGLLDAAKAAGARLFERTDVTAIERDASSFVVHTARGAIRAGRVVNAAGGFAATIGRMLGADLPVFGAPLQMIVTEAAVPTLSRLVAHADRHLSLKQAANGNFIVGGGWPAGLDPVHGHPRPLRSSLEGNLWVAQRVAPALRKLHVIRSWAAINVDIDGAPILGEHPDIAGFFNVVAANGYTLGPLLGRMTADLIVRGQTDRDIRPFSVTRFRS